MLQYLYVRTARRLRRTHRVNGLPLARALELLEMEYVASARWNFSALAQAAARGDKGEVAGLLASGAMVNEIDDAPYIDPFGGRQPPSTLSALYLAAAKGHAAQHRIRKKVLSLQPLEPTWSHGVLFCSRATRFPPPTALTPPPLSPPPPQAIKKSKKLAKRKTLKFAVDCSQPVDDGIMDAASFVSRERGAPGLDGWG